MDELIVALMTPNGVKSSESTLDKVMAWHLATVHYQAITQTNVDLLSIGPLAINFKLSQVKYVLLLHTNGKLYITQWS